MFARGEQRDKTRQPPDARECLSHRARPPAQHDLSGARGSPGECGYGCPKRAKALANGSRAQRVLLSASHHASRVPRHHLQPGLLPSPWQLRLGLRPPTRARPLIAACLSQSTMTLARLQSPPLAGTWCWPAGQDCASWISTTCILLRSSSPTNHPGT